MYMPPLFDKSIAFEAAALVNQAYDQLHEGNAWSLQGNYDELGSPVRPPGMGSSARAIWFRGSQPHLRPRLRRLPRY